MDKKTADAEVRVEEASAETHADLRVAMAKIRAILKEHDCAGHVVICKPGAAEVRIDLNASWSAANVDDEGSFSFDTRLRPPGPERDRLVGETANVIHMLADLLGGAALSLIDCDELLQAEFDLHHTESRKVHTPRTH